MIVFSTMVNDGDEQIVALERVEISDDEDDDFDYGLEAEDEDFDDEDDDDEDLDRALASLKNEGISRDTPALAPRSTTQVRPSVVDDFIRNFMIKVGMSRSLDSFNTEWFELQAKGKLTEEDIGVVPDIYLRNQALDEQVKGLRGQLSKMEEITAKAQGTWDKFRKERDFHRMHHKRVVQEKRKLVADIKKLKNHYEGYEPTLEALKNKYELAMKEKMLMRLERDRMSSRVEGLEAQIRALEGAPQPMPEKKVRTKRKGGDTLIPPDGAENPYINVEFEPPQIERFQLSKTFKGHQNSVACLAFHPKKPILATVSDDETWKLWSLPTGDLIMSGEGHRGWVSGVDFHPSGTHLATSSGDNTVKLWNFQTASCVATFQDHSQAVWDTAFHYTGDFLASSSMDHTAKLWDLNTSKCRQTFRGHVDSINSVCFQPFTNNICTGSGDKTVSLWDIRSGLCLQTFYGHMNSCNHVAFNLRGDTIASCDSDGVVKLWDVRMVAERDTLSMGQHPINKCEFDRSGNALAAASDDGKVKVFNLLEGGDHKELKGHEDAVQTVLWDPTGQYLVSGGSDCTFRIWSA